MQEALPILDVIPQVKEMLRAGNTLILQAPPGAGKSTVLPLELLDEPWLAGKKILMLEPRRLAARAVAGRMAMLKAENVGDTVGFRVRFESKVSGSTRIEVLTEGILTRMLQNDNALEDAGLVIFDEFHERSLHADLALALCREIQQVLREDLRILIMSATLDKEKMSEMLGNAPVVKSEGRQYPVTLKYIAREEYVPVAVQAAKAAMRALRQESGDILVFLPGAGEIRRTQELLEAESTGARILPLYGELSQKEQQEAITPDPHGRRKVVLATSIAETSLTIQGINVVVDSGYARTSRFDPRSGLTRLETITVTQDSADQRAGRAGRLGPGVCYRLWSQESHFRLSPERKPEILEADLSPLMLELAQWGIKEVRSLAWLTPPPQGAVAQAQSLLHQLEATAEQQITARGRAMLALPTHPRLAHMLLEGKEYDLLALATDLAAVLEEKDPLNKEAGTDLSYRIEILRKWRSGERVNADQGVLNRIEKLAANWRKILRIGADNSMPAAEDAARLIAAAYPERIAQKTEQQGRYRLSNGRMARLPEHDSLRNSDFLAVAQMDAGTNEGKIYLAAPLDVNDLLPHAQEKDIVAWDNRNGILISRREMRLGGLVLSSKPLPKIPEDESARILLEVVQNEGLNLLPWSEDTDNWQARILCLRKWRPEEEWPDVSKEQLLADAEDWLMPYLTGIRKKDDFKKLDLLSLLQNILPWPLQQKLNELAPASISVPSGSSIKLQYQPDGSAAVLAVRLQEMFGLADTPRINQGRNAVLIHLLSPGYKPVQVTQDLRSFWQNHYPDVRKQLRMRYPKHSWPEDPWTAEAVRGAKKRNV